MYVHYFHKDVIILNSLALCVCVCVFYTFMHEEIKKIKKQNIRNIKF